MIKYIFLIVFSCSLSQFSGEYIDEKRVKIHLNILNQKAMLLKQLKRCNKRLKATSFCVKDVCFVTLVCLLVTHQLHQFVKFSQLKTNYILGVHLMTYKK